MAIEIPLRAKYREAVNGHHKSRSSNNGANRHRGETDKAKLLAAQEQTRANQKVLVLKDGRKQVWMRQSEWEQMDHS